MVNLIEEEVALEEEIEQVDKFKQSIYAVMIKIKDMASLRPPDAAAAPLKKPKYEMTAKWRFLV